ncbi:MAG: DUF885 domain-containing protein [Thermoanaerobaculia bacterium]
MKAARRTAALLLTLAVAVPLFAEPEWVRRSNEITAIVLEVQAKLQPEGASFIGVEGYDHEISQLPLDVNARAIAALLDARARIAAKLTTEKDPAVRQDIEILLHSIDEQVEGIRLGEKYELPYFDLPQAFFNGTRSVLDERVAKERHGAALVRLRKYTGLDKGFTPLTHQAIALLRASMKNPALRGPVRDDLEKNLANSERYLTGAEQLFQKFGVAGYEEPFAELRKQVAEYNAFLRAEVMPRTTTDFRLPADLYAYRLASRGVDMPVEELISRAKTSFREIQNEMNSLAPLVAKEKGIAATDYRDVIRELKKKQLVGDAILPHYKARLEEIEKIVRDQRLVTLPQREMIIRLASPAETAAIPAPHVDPPRLIGNTGEMAAFVLPLRIPAEGGKEEIGFDDFTFDAASWTLTVHEGRPGHELQFASIMEKGVSQARVLYAFNSVNVEGWGLYAEAEMKPYEPLDGQLIALQHRLMRAARAFIDPSLHLGRITRNEAFRVLEEDVVLSHGMALQEVERYTFRTPDQAPSYYVGYSRLIELRADAERMLGKSFDRLSYHDFILAQGLLSPSMLRKAVMEDYVKPRVSAPAPRRD